MPCLVHVQDLHCQLAAKNIWNWKVKTEIETEIKKNWTETKQNKKASIRWQDSARRQFQAGLRGDLGL